MRARVPGLTVALLGPDGVGKSTLLAGLAQTYPAPVRQTWMAAAALSPRVVGVFRGDRRSA